MINQRTAFGISIGAFVLAFAGSAVANDRPNIVLVFTDDQGYGDLGCYGSPNIETPNIDRMASEGIRFTSFYAAPFCGPSRAQLMTGCYHARVGHSHNEGPRAATGLHPDEITIAELVKSVGYATKHIGKWHLGDAPQFLPTRQGFDSFFGVPFSNDMWPYHPKMPPRDDEDELMRKMRERAAYTGFAGQGSYYPPGGGFPHPLPLMRDEEVIERNPDQTQLTTRYTEEALKFIEANRDQPFFLYLAHAMPHVPLFVSDKFAGKSPRGLYGDVIMEIDWSCGEILKKLKDLGIAENTLVIFTSDNGPWLGYGIDGGSAGPLREGKASTWEGGMRVPGVFYWPGKVAAGRRTDAVAGNLDLLPTIAHLAGAELPDDRVIDGKNLWPILTGETNDGPHDFFHYFGGARPGETSYRGVRDARWKLLVGVRGDGKLNARELYDLGADPGEQFDRLKHHPEIAQRLLDEAERFRTDLLANRRPLGRKPAVQAGAAANSKPPVTLASLLDEMVDRTALARWPNPAYTCRQQSSYDSNSLAAGQPGWFANWYRSHFVQVEKNVTAVVLAFVQLGSSRGKADDEDEQRRMQAITAAEAQLEFAERNMARAVKLREAKAISDKDVDINRNQLAQARLKLAILHDDQSEILASLREIVQCQETRLEYFERLRDRKVFGNEEVETCRLRLADTRIHLELRTIVGIRKKQLERLLKPQDGQGASASDIERARKELEDAEKRVELLRR